MDRRSSPATLTDYVVVALNPALIVIVITSVMFFLVDITYHGNYSARLKFIFFMYVMGTVAVNRISLEQGFNYAALFGLPLAGASFLAINTFVKYEGTFSEISSLLNIVFMSLVWWLAYKLTQDCTVFAEQDTKADRGLAEELRLVTEDALQPPPASDAHSQTLSDKLLAWLQKLWRLPAGRPNGMWVLYFALFAIPLFGLGAEYFSCCDSVHRKLTNVMVYAAGSLALLMNTSFLGIRGYLRRRRVEMNTEMTVVWLASGASVIVVVAIIALVLPRPGMKIPFTETKFRLWSTPTRVASQWGWGHEGAKPTAPPPQSSVLNRNGGGPGGKSSSSEKAVTSSAEKGNGASSAGSSTSSNEKQDSSAQSSGDKSSENQQGASSTGGKGSSGSQGSGGGAKSNSGAQQKSSGAQKSSGGGSSAQGSGSGEKSQGDKSPAEKSPQQKSSQQKSAGEKGEQSRAPNKQDQANQPNSAPPQSSSEKPSDDKSGENQSSPDETTSPTSSSLTMAKSILRTLLDTLGSLLRFGFLAVIVGVALYFAWRYREQLRQFWQELLAEWRRWWDLWMGKRETPTSSSPLAPPPPSFASFSDPFLTGRARSMSAAQVVGYTYQALNAWAREEGITPNSAETPHEFADRLAPLDLFTDEVTLLADYHSRLAYGDGKTPANYEVVLRILWEKMRTAHATAS